jgi:hypothetical protein
VLLEEARQDINRPERGLGGIAENRPRDRAAEIHVEALPVLARIVLRKPGNIVAKTAGHDASGFYGVETRSGAGSAREKRKAESESQCR